MINPLHTSCRDCAFAKYHGSRQMSCDLGRIKAYREAGAEVIEAFDDKGKEFFVINDRACVMKRSKEWASQFAKAALKDIVLNQAKIPYHVMLILEREQDIPQLIKQVSVLDGQDTPPTIVSIVSTCTPDSLYKMNMKISALINKFNNIEYRIQNTIDADRTVRELIDLAADATHFKHKTSYYLVFEVTKEIPPFFSKDLADAIYNDGKQVIFVYPTEGVHCIVSNTFIHRKHTGNAFNVHLEDKIEAFEEGANNFMFNAMDIFKFNG